MHPEVEEVRPKLKEILYDCAVEIRATKAALYLRDDAVGRFEVVAEYGFRGGGLPLSVDVNHPIVDRCGRGRTPFFLNGLTVEPRFSEILYEAKSERLLVIPMYMRGQLVGFIDMRDKAQKQPFAQTDVAPGQRIADRILALFGNKNVFGQRFITLSEHHEIAPAPPPPTQHAPAPAPAAVAAAPAVAPMPPPVPAARPQREAPRVHVPRLATLVLEARNAMTRIIVPPPPQAIGEAELSAVRDVLRSLLLIPGASAAMFSAFAVSGGVQEIASHSTMTDEAKNFLQSKLNVWLTKRGEGGGFARTSVQTPLGTSGPPVTPAQLQKVFTAPLQVPSMSGLYLTVAFANPPDRAAHDLLAALHSSLQIAIEQVGQREAAASMRMRVAERLVEPDFAKFPELRRHTDVVVGLTDRFAHHLSLGAPETETLRLAALVHDCGMRLLDYEHLYRKKDLSPDELSILREHVAVGAALVEPVLGGEVARAVLCHHERWDGRGYPNELHAEEIPFASRVLQLCDAYAAMTDPDSYRPPDPPEAALSAISRAGGTQFDPSLTTRFVEFARATIR